MKSKKLLLILCAFTTLLTSCGANELNITPFIPKESYISENIIPDFDFFNGFKVQSQKDHANGDAFRELGKFSYNDETEPLWSLSQWDSGPCLWENNISQDKYCLTDGTSKWVTYDPEEKSLLLRLNTEAYYNGKGAVAGDYWPHLLIEQNFPFAELPEEKKILRTGEAEKHVLSFDIRLPQYSSTFNEEDWVEAAQFYIYFGIVDKNENKFVWFGLQLFDSRYEYSELSYNIDAGKDDASGLPIYLIGMEDVYAENKTFWENGKPQSSDEWIHIEIDLKPHLENMLKIAIENGYYNKKTKISDLYFHYMNLGWETIATFDCGLEIKNLSLDSGITIWE